MRKEGIFTMNGYRYDPHTHTAETSRCGHLYAADVVDRYVQNGFTGLVVTDHLHPEYLSRIDTERTTGAGAIPKAVACLWDMFF